MTDQTASGLSELVKRLREKNGKRPCDCVSCDCHNSGDTYYVGSWDGTDWVLNEIAALCSMAEAQRREVEEDDSAKQVSDGMYSEKVDEVLSLIEALEAIATLNAGHDEQCREVRRIALTAIAEQSTDGEARDNAARERALMSIPSPSPTGAVRRVPVALLEQIYTLLEAHAQFGMTEKYDDGSKTPNALLCEEIVGKIKAMLAASPAGEQGEPGEHIGTVVGHKEFGLALVEWADNGLRPIGTKLYATPQPQQDAGEEG